jgi:hypothetical protein
MGPSALAFLQLGECPDSLDSMLPFMPTTIQPEMVIRWHRDEFRLYLKWKSRS